MDADTAQPFDYDGTATHGSPEIDPVQAHDPHLIAPEAGTHPRPTGAAGFGSGGISAASSRRSISPTAGETSPPLASASFTC